MIIEPLLFASAGALMGMIGGLLPGINNTVILVSLFFFLIKFDPLLICVFFISCLTVGQYMGSVTATLLGAPGESTSIPAVKEGFTMHQQGRGRFALSVSAWGSLIGSLIAVSMALALWPVINQMFLLSYTEVRVSFFLILILVLIFAGQNKSWENMILVVLGLSLGSVGLSFDQTSSWGTFGNIYLAGGIPSITVIVFLFAMPMILSLWDRDPLKKLDINQRRPLAMSESLGSLPYRSIVRGSVLGFIVGLIPGLTYVVSSKFAWVLEKFLQRKDYKIGDARCLAAAETANNAAVLGCLIPFLMFIIPITVSEALVMDMINLTSSPFSPGWLLKDYHYVTIISMFALANFIGFVLAYPLGQHSVKIILKWNKFAIPAVIMIMLLGVIQNAISIGQLNYYIIVGVILFGIGWLLRKKDLIPFIFMFLLADQINLLWSIVVQKYL